MRRVWRTYQGVLELAREFETETGRVEKAGHLSFGRYELHLGPESAPFHTYAEDTSVWEVPFIGGVKPLIKLSATTYRETEKSVEVVDKDRALEDLKEEAFAYVKGRIPRGAKILDEREELKYSEERKWMYTLTIESLEDIAEERSEEREVEY